MSEAVWDQFLTKRDHEVFAGGGFGARQGYGKRPALLIVDVNYFFAVTSQNLFSNRSSAGVPLAVRRPGTGLRRLCDCSPLAVSVACL